MPRQPRWVLAALLLVASGPFFLLASASAQTTADALIFPSESLALVPGAAGFTTSVSVANPTSDALSVAVSDPSIGDQANECAVALTGGVVEVLPHRSRTLVATIGAGGEACADPTDGKQSIVLIVVGPAGERVPNILRLQKAGASEVKATGLEWPDEPVFLRRRDSSLTGSFIVVNPTGSAIEVTPPSFDDACALESPSRADSVTVPAGSPATIPITMPFDCDALHRSEVVATTTASTPDRAKADTHKLILQGEVDWGRFGLVLSIGLLALTAVAFSTAVLTGRRHKDRHTSLGSPLLTSSATPTSWLTSIGTIGPLVTTLVSTAGLSEGLLGVDSTPQATLIVGAGAVSVALVAIAGVVTGIPVTTETIEGKPQQAPTIWQFALGAGITAGAAELQIWAVRRALLRLDLNVDSRLIGFVALVAAGLLVWYLTVTVSHYIARFAKPTTAPLPQEDTELVRAVVAALVPSYGAGDVASTPAKRQAWIEAVEAAVTDAKAAAGGQAPMQEDPRQRRSSPAGATRNLI